MFERLTQLLTSSKPYDLDDVANLLKTNPNALKEFETAYMTAEFNEGISDNLFKINAKQMSEIKKSENEESADTTIINRIVNELIAQTQMYEYDSNTKQSTIYDYTHALSDNECVTKEEIMALPENIRPNITGKLMHIDIPDSGNILAEMWFKYKTTTNQNAKKHFYNSFRQGLDLLDIDNLTYAMIDTNPNSMGYWLPKIVKAVDDEKFFKIPSTKIIKVPLSILQLTRNEYSSLTKSTLQIIDKYCYDVFNLKDNGNYFIKTGTYSSKFDFRNAHVYSAPEIRELGEYLLFIHWQALQMAHYDLSGHHQPIIYGVSTTTEWVVREFIEDNEHNLTIYNGLPLRTEYRAFVDFDTDTVLNIHPYWDPEVMRKKFAQTSDTDIQAKHDYITYTANQEKLMNRYNSNINKVTQHLQNIVSNIPMHGQWSIDIMENGNDFYIIDMALAENSMFYDCVPESLRNPIDENWIPALPNYTKEQN